MTIVPAPARAGHIQRARGAGQALVALLVLLLVATGCQGQKADATGPAPAFPAPRGTCAAPWLTITSPVAGAVLEPSAFPLVGQSPPDGPGLIWAVLDRTGRSLQTGSVSPATDGRVYTVPLQLGAGAYTLLVERAGATDGGAVGPCDQARIGVTVSATPGVTSWESGASGGGVADGRFAAWRKARVSIAGSWADNDWAEVHLPQLQPGGEYGSWQGDLDLAVGAIDPGETWAAAAHGADDARWRASLQQMARLWAGRPGTLSIRFAHEFNGNWYPWGVTAATVPDFIAAWKRYRALQQQYFPASRLVFAPNSETAGTDFDWRTAFPGAQYVDVLSTSYFNQSPYTDSVDSFRVVSMAVDSYGAPRGLQRHLDFARSVGLPFAVSEWGGNSDGGDSPAYVEGMNQFFRANAGTGPGKLTYEIYFNVAESRNPFALMPQTNMPESAAAYLRLW